MANSLLITRGATSGVNFVDNTTRYSRICGALAAGTTEANEETPIRVAGTFSNLYVRVTANTASVNSTVTLRNSGTDTSVTVTISSDATGVFEDTSNTANFSDTDEAAYAIVVPTEAGTNNLTLEIISIQFAPTDTTKCVTFLRAGLPGGTINITTASSSQSTNVNSNSLTFSTTTESNHQASIRSTCEASYFNAYVTSNARTTDTTFKLRKNSADANQSVTYGSGQTGYKEDASNTDSLVIDDKICYGFTTGTGTETLSLAAIGCQLISTNNSFLFSTGHPSGVSVSFNVTTYFSCGSVFGADTTEEHNQTAPRFNFVASQLAAYVSANTITTSATTLTVRDNGSDTSIAVSWNAGQTGEKIDNSNTSFIGNNSQEINYKVVTPNTSGSITFRNWTLLGTDISVQVTSETDTSLSLSLLKKLTTGLSVETDTSLSLSLLKKLTTGLSAETDSSETLTASILHDTTEPELSLIVMKYAKNLPFIRLDVIWQCDSTGIWEQVIDHRTLGYNLFGYLDYFTSKPDPSIPSASIIEVTLLDKAGNDLLNGAGASVSNSNSALYKVSTSLSNARAGRVPVKFDYLKLIIDTGSAQVSAGRLSFYIRRINI